MQKEMVDVLDKNGIATGVVISKDDAHKDKLWHRSAHIWIYNSKGEVLLQKRAAIKRSWPGKWDISCAGHVSSKERPKDSALRELEEEIGIKTDPRNLKYITIVKNKMDIKGIKFYEREFCHIYLLKYDKLPTKLQKEEVGAVRFISIKKFRDDINDKKAFAKYVPHSKRYYFFIIRLMEEALHQKSKKEIKIQKARSFS